MHNHARHNLLPNTSSNMKSKPCSATSLVVGGYMLCSATLLISNKYAIYKVAAPSFILLSQLMGTAFIVKAFAAIGQIECDPLKKEKAIKFLPVAFIFLATIYCNMKSLQYANVETFMVFRFSTPLVISIADYLFLGRSLPSLRSWLCLFALVAGALLYVTTDSAFHVKGYTFCAFWYCIFCLDQIYLKHITNTVKMQSVWGHVFYSNFLASIPLIFIFSNSTSEMLAVKNISYSGGVAVFVSVALGVGMSYFAWKTRSLLSAASFTVVGNSCKVLTIAINVALWDKHASPTGILALMFCLGAAYFYEQAPLRTGESQRLSTNLTLLVASITKKRMIFFCLAAYLASKNLHVVLYFNERQGNYGRFMIFPFTQYGPNVQLLGLRQTLSFCTLLDVRCIEPGFSDLFVEHSYALTDFYDISMLGMVPRNSLPSPLKPDVFIYGIISNGKPRWPITAYFRMHNISYQEDPSKGNGYSKTVVGSSNDMGQEENINLTLAELRREYELFLQQPAETRKDHVVALVYPALFGHARNYFQPKKPLLSPYQQVFANFRPKMSLIKSAEEVIKSLFPSDKRFIAVHLRLRDHCKNSIEECCCETSGNRNSMNRSSIENFVEGYRISSGVRNVYITGPPSLQKMADEWEWVMKNSDSIKLWYSSTAPGSHEESLIQQIICSKASVFLYSNSASTWGLTLKLWQEGEPINALIGESDELTNSALHRRYINLTSLKYMVGESTDVRKAEEYLPPAQENLSWSQMEYFADLRRRLYKASNITNCSVNSTMFAMQRTDSFGATFHFIHLALGRAISRDQPLVLMTEEPNGQWIWGGTCPLHDWSCNFLPTHSCDKSSHGLQASMDLIQREWKDDSKPCPSPWCQTWNRRDFQYDSMGPLSLGIPESGISSVMYRAQLSAFLFRLNPGMMHLIDDRSFIYVPSESVSTKKVLLREVLERTAKPSDWSVMAMHVRHGDACQDPRKIRKCFAFHEYMEYAAKMRHLYGTDTIILATDNEDVVQAAVANYTEWHWYFQDIDRKKYVVKDQNEYSRGEHMINRMRNEKYNRRQVTIETLTDITALSKAGVFIGTFTSDFGRLVYELIVAHASDHIPPFASLQGTFCAGAVPITRRPVYLCE